MKKLQDLVSFVLLALIILSLPLSAFASCNIPVTIYSVRSGNFTAASTWDRNIVPSSCDIVVIRHNVVLNQGFMVGDNQSKAGQLIIEPSGTLNGITRSISIALNSVVNNQGTLHIGGLDFWGNSATFRNYGIATIQNTIYANALSHIQNFATLTLNNGLDQNGNTFINYKDAVARIKGELKLQNGTIEALLQNFGTITIEKPVTINQGAVINEPMGALNILSDLIVNSGSGTNSINNKGTLSIGQDFRTNPVSSVYNSDKLVVNRDFDNRSAFVNEGGTVDIIRNFFQGNQQSARFVNNKGGLVTFHNDFWNDGLVSGDRGIYIIKGISTITANGRFDGDIDICDETLTSGDIDRQDPNSKIGKEVTYCNAFRFNAPLPVALFGFSAKADKGSVILKWQTAQEVNSAEFIIERSISGIQFESIGLVNAAGSSSSILQYRFEDRMPLNGLAYYRLKQIDTDNSFEYSSTIAVKQKMELESIKLYPQPAVSGKALFVQLQNSKMMPLRAELVSLEGKLVQSQNLDMISPKDLFQFNMPYLQPGVYFLQLLNSSQNILYRNRVLVK
ncbi:T9SS type A sorting domain-containing protein [Adhaeribacter soli]|uniref:T9SS type A sorting domain-containing protein n=1 Tax=Adhaeribacter soli TaxID=2607655 RepID=A0A5N1J2P9_9BACT|nr:T9SS type A sorting domain-containing protein [Adhaeribacter soli]KAA9338813.1 T9SS type A sorting domain-containing protein [Adhaeribacter soli]